jgi:hypothetical protein
MATPRHQDLAMRVHAGSVSCLVVAMCVPVASMAGVAASNDAAGAASDDARPAADQKAEPTAPRMQSSHVAMLSNAFAAKRIGAFDYHVTQLAYEVEPGSRRWTIHYELGPAPDGTQPDPAQFDVWVEDRTGKLSFADDR